ncbi:ARM repeat-containing protein [Anaeromyces robustus]|uniref:ARM repeat-containing protein n=1 Tax=Anaeromyces robustus TaxID=1754192 RepID=A0A1Y1X5G5_9FUNG|nr:ARM repeat-containing protein [Anaeromyces robustus]|eukprot:ORX81049.1 ARM repeat-containing protein [Anaeromyces robustus]
MAKKNTKKELKEEIDEMEYENDEYNDEYDEEELKNDEEMEEEEEEEEGEDENETEAKKPRLDNQQPKNQLTPEQKAANRQAQKQLKNERKAQNPSYEIISEAKGIWETLRLKRNTKDERKELMERLMNIIRGRVQEIIFKHDASRIIQCAVKYGNQSQRSEIAKELKGRYVELSKSVYGRFIISRVLAYCTEERASVISEFYGKVLKLIKHKEASLIIEEAYSQYANATQRTALIEEFYGPEFAIFKTKENRSIEQLMAQPIKKESILKHLQHTLTSILGKGGWDITSHTIVHRALMEYFQYADERSIQSMIEFVKDHIVHILHTREGAYAARRAFLYGTPKERKYIIKTFKSYVAKIACEQYGHTVLLTIFDCVDDTTLVQKSILSELTKKVKPTTTIIGTEEDAENVGLINVITNRWGSRVALYLLSHREGKYFSPSDIKLLEEGDAIRATTSKKDPEIRRKELLKAFSPPMIEICTKYAEQLMKDRVSSPVVYETLRCAEGEKDELIKSIANVTKGTIEEYKEEHVEKKEEDEYFNAIKKLAAEKAEAKFVETENEHPLVSRTSNQLIKNIIMLSKSEKEEEQKIGKAFIEAFYETIKDNLTYWVKYCAKDAFHTSGIAYAFLALLENADKSIAKNIKSSLKPVISKLKINKENKTLTNENNNNKKRKRNGGGKAQKPKIDKSKLDGGEYLTGIEKFIKTLKN